MVPRPCSALIEPPRATARAWTMAAPSSRPARCAASAPPSGPRTSKWTLPSPTWPKASMRTPGNFAASAAVAQSEAQSRAFWALREGQSAAQKPEGPAWKHDISVPISAIADFIGGASAALAAKFPGVRIDAFGHVGDGNVHFDVLGPEGGADAAHLAGRDEGAAD